jgi:hypothetical protein
MRDLASLQRAFQRHIYKPGMAMEGVVLATPCAGATRRLGVYVDAYSARLIDVLSSDYPALLNLLGVTDFDCMAREYIALNPSCQRNVRWYGAQLPRFLSRSRKWHRNPLLADMAHFEWALGLAFDALDAPTTTASEVARVLPADWPSMRMGLHPSVQLVRVHRNVPEVWRMTISDREPTPAAIHARRSVWLVWRKGHEPLYRALSQKEAWALRGVARGLDFASLCSGLRRYVVPQHAAQTCAQLLRNWIFEGLICRIEAGL